MKNSVDANVANSNRLLELDILRAAAIIFIVCFHQALFVFKETYTGIIISSFMGYLSSLGTGLFFFISGFILYEKAKKSNVKDYYIRRIIRIFPLYLFGICLIVIVNNYSAIGIYLTHFNKIDVLIYVLCLQEIIAPIYKFNEMPALWFVGVIMIFYLVLPVMVRSENPKDILLISLGIFLLFVVLRLSFDILGFRVFSSYGIFAFGVLAKASNLFAVNNYGRITFSVIAFIIGSCIVFMHTLTFFSGEGILFDQLLIYIIVDITSISFCYLAYLISIHLSSSIPCIFIQVIHALAISSYVAFLIHSPLLNLVMGLLQIHPTGHNILFAYFIGIPIIFIVSYIIQRTELIIALLFNPHSALRIK